MTDKTIKSPQKPILKPGEGLAQDGALVPKPRPVPQPKPDNPKDKK